MNAQIMRICPDLNSLQLISRQEFHALAPSQRPWSLSPEVWDEIHNKMGLRGQDAILVSIDDGVDATHEAFGNRVIHEESFVPRENPRDGAVHGTHTTGTMAGGFGIGVAPEARVINLKGLSRDGSGSSDWLTRCIRRAVELKLSARWDAPIWNINMSFGGPWYQPQEDALQAAEEAGLDGSASAGNAGHRGTRPTCGHPGNSRFATSVGSHDRDGSLSQFSSQCSELDIVAPGGGIYSSVPGQRYQLMSGTSMSGPFITGAKALINQALLHSGGVLIHRAAEWNEFFKANAIDRGPVGHDPQHGYGVLQYSELMKKLATDDLKWL